jgi:uncharacterized protein (TIGR02246 family)
MAVALYSRTKLKGRYVVRPLVKGFSVPKNIEHTAAAYTRAWNSGSAEAVAGFYADDGSIVINRGTPWNGRAGVTAMAAGFLPMCLT